MGNCTGCTNPDRRLRGQYQLPRQQSLQTRYDSPQIPKSNSKQQILHNSINAYTQPSQYKQKQNNQDPWKSRIASRTVKKYVRMPTLREQEMANGNLSNKDKQKENSNNGDNSTMQPNPFISFKNPVSDKPIRAESFQQSIYVRKNLGEKQLREVYKMQYNQGFCQEPEQIKQIFLEGSSTSKPYSLQSTPTNKNYMPVSTFVKAQKFQPPSRYFPKKQDRLREKQLEQIMQLVEKDAQTPGYVKNIRRQHGQDVKMNNFHKFEAVGQFQWFSIGKYLTQIDKQGNQQGIDSKLEQTQKKQQKQRSNDRSSMKGTKKKGNLKISIEQQDEKIERRGIEIAAK